MASFSISRSPFFTLARLMSRVTFQETHIVPSRRIIPTVTLKGHHHPVPSSSSLFQTRYLHTTHSANGTAYEPDGKTTVTVLNDEKGAPLMIDSYNTGGFKLNNKMRVFGPIAIFPKTVLSWDVGNIKDITPESVALFTVLEPKPDVLVIGVGNQGNQLPVETIMYLKKKGINLEILATVHACTTFNFLSEEGRCVAAVILPPETIHWTGHDLANSKLQKKELYDPDHD